MMYDHDSTKDPVPTINPLAFNPGASDCQLTGIHAAVSSTLYTCNLALEAEGGLINQVIEHPAWDLQLRAVASALKHAHDLLETAR